MPYGIVRDGQGSTIQFGVYNGKYFPTVPGLDLYKEFPRIPELPCRDDDITVVAYQKAGTHWTWEIANMLCKGDGKLSPRLKEESMLELNVLESLADLPSTRLLNTHLTPNFYPRDLVKRKNKIIFVQRNPKDIFVSYFHHARKFTPYDYEGEWAGFFELCLTGECEYGSWFTWTKEWTKFLNENIDLPVLRLYYEEMKLDLPGAVKQIAQFLDVPCDQSYCKTVAAKCGFESMKAGCQLPPEYKDIVKGDGNPLMRKGIVGDWKNHFTVAQNERFDELYNKEMDGFSFPFDQYMK